MTTKKELLTEQKEELLEVLKNRFEKNMIRHKNINWVDVRAKLEKNDDKLWILNEMEKTWGEPDVIDYDEKSLEYVFCDCSIESPKGRRSLCYDRESLDSRKEFKPGNNAVDLASAMWIELLNEEQYIGLQKLWNFDTKTSSWLKTPDSIRKLWWAIFWDCRYDSVFIYHNWASSYYAARGFRGLVRI